VEVNIASWKDMADSIPHGLGDSDEVVEKVLDKYSWEVRELMEIAQRGNERGHDVSVYMGKFEGQIAFFEVRAKDMPVQNQYNWHGQNTSQWLYAGCIQVSPDGYVSSHH